MQFGKVSFNITGLMIFLQAIHIEDAVYIIMIATNGSILIDNHSYFEGAFDQ
jgi:uncharacterized membrane protein